MSSRWLKGGIAIHRRWALVLGNSRQPLLSAGVAAWKPPRARNGQPVLCRLGQHRGAARAFFRQGPMEWDKLSSWAWRVVDRARQRGKMQRGIGAGLLLLLFTGRTTQHPMLRAQRCHSEFVWLQTVESEDRDESRTRPTGGEHVQAGHALEKRLHRLVGAGETANCGSYATPGRVRSDGHGAERERGGSER